MDREEQAKKMQQIVAKAWADETFKQKLLAEPMATLKGEGLEVPVGVEIRVVENTDKVSHLVLPRKPASAELNMEALEKVAGGATVPCEPGEHPEIPVPFFLLQ